MATKLAELEERLQKLEAQFRELQKATRPAKPIAWHRQAAGQFKDDPVFDEIVRLGKEIRDKERIPKRTTPKRTVRRKGKADPSSQQPWYDQILGMFDDDPGFDEMVRLGKELRDRDRGPSSAPRKRTPSSKGDR